MSEYIFVHLLDKRPVGTNVGLSIPLHMTVLHWFETAQPRETIVGEAQIALQSISTIAATAAGRDFFGPHNGIPVMRLSRTPELVSLHTSLLTSMQRLGATFNMNWSGANNWNPHISDKPGTSLSVGDEVIINDIDLAVRSEKSGVRMLLHRFELE